MNNIQINILDENDNVLGVLDLTDSEDFGFKLTKSLASFKDISKRSTNYSLDFTAPNTDNNNRLLFGLGDVNATGGSRDILGQRKCFVLVNGNQLDSGFVYGFENELGGEYKLFFKGGNNDWLELIGDLELNQLPWRDYQSGLYDVDAFEIFTSNRMYFLSFGTSANYDLTYPIINRNNDIDFIHRRPSIHFKAFWNSLFYYLGYTYSGNFLDSDWITGDVPVLDDFGNTYTHLGLAIDPAFVFTLDDDQVKDNLAEYNVPSNAITKEFVQATPVTQVNDFIGNRGTFLSPTVVHFSRYNNYYTNEVSDVNFLFDIPTSTFTVLKTGNYVVDIEFNFWVYWAPLADLFYEFSSLNGVQGTNPPSLIVNIVKGNTQNNTIDGTILQTITVPSTQWDYNTFTGGGGQVFTAKLTNFLVNVILDSGDDISFVVQMGTDATTTDSNYPNLVSYGSKAWRFQISNSSKVKVVLKNTVELGDSFRINSHIPKGIKVIDLIKDFKNMFNLYFDADTKSKTVLIDPRDDFFYDISTAKDITNEIDLSSSPKIDLSTNYKKILSFAFSQDSSDKYLSRWEGFYDRTYAEYSHSFETQNRFEKGEETLTLSQFSACIQKNIEGASGLITSIIKEEYLPQNNAQKGVTVKYKPKIYQLIYGQQHDRYNNPLLGQLNDPAVCVGIMEAYAAIPTFEGRKLTFNGVRGLVYDYYLKTLANINDTAEVTLKQKITLHDFFNLDLKRPVYISAPEKIKGYYIYDSIKNFDVTKNVPVTVVLNKYKDYVPAAFDNSQSTNVNEIIDNVPNEDNALKVVVNGLILDVYDNNSNKLYKI